MVQWESCSTVRAVIAASSSPGLLRCSRSISRRTTIQLNPAPAITGGLRHPSQPLEALQQEGPQPERLVPDPIHGSLKHHTVVVCGPHQILIAQHPWYVFDCPCEDRKEG